MVPVVFILVKQEEGQVTVDQERYIEAMFEQFQMDQCKPSGSPAGFNSKLLQHGTQTKKWTKGTTEA